MSKDILIGIDYGTGNEHSVYTVGKRINGEMYIIDTGKIEDFDYSKYESTDHQVVGEHVDLEKFKGQFLK